MANVSGKALLSQVNDYLDYAQIKIGNFRLNSEWLNIR